MRCPYCGETCVDAFTGKQFKVKNKMKLNKNIPLRLKIRIIVIAIKLAFGSFFAKLRKMMKQNGYR